MKPLVPIEIPVSLPRAVVAYDLAVLPWSSQGNVVLVAVYFFSKQVL